MIAGWRLVICDKTAGRISIFYGIVTLGLLGGRQLGNKMHMLTRLLGALPRNMSVPVLVLLAGWYGGAKYGAPDYLMSSVDGIVEQGSGLVSGLLSQVGGESDDEAEAISE